MIVPTKEDREQFLNAIEHLPELKEPLPESINNQEIKADAGKPKLTLVPTQIIYDIARVREFGVAKYGKKESWKDVEIERYRDALFRHLLLYINDPQGVDEESGLTHLSHVACNVAFLCELEKEIKDGKSMG